MDLRANTAVDVLIGPFVDKTDGNTTEDGLTLTAAEIKLSKNGQALTLKSDVTAAAFDDDGYYNCELDATDTNTEGSLVLIVHQSANALPVRHEFNVLAEAAWDSLYVAKDSGLMSVNVSTVTEATQTAGDLAALIGALGLTGGGTLNFEANADNSGGTIDPGTTAFVGVETNNYTDTALEDGTYHVIADSVNVIDVVYGFSVGGGRTATEVIFRGFANANGDDLTVSAWDHVGAGWDALGTLEGKNTTTNVNIILQLLSRHTGTSAAEIGKTYLRFNGSGLSASADLNTDQLLVQAVNIGQSVGYELGRIWLDTNLSNTNTEKFVDGVADRAVSTIAAAKTISGSTGLVDFQILNGSSVVLGESTDNESYFGDNWSLDLNGQSVDGAHFEGATVTGAGPSAATVGFDGCNFGTASLALAHCDFCAFAGTITQTTAGTYEYHNCYSKGTTPPVFTKTAGQAINVEFHNWSGDITISGLEAGDVIELGGNFRTIVLNGADATVHIHGHYETLTNNLAGAPTVEITGATKFADAADILVDTAEIGTAGVGLTDLGGMSAGMKAEVNVEALDVLVTDTHVEPTQGAPGGTVSLKDKIGFLYKAWRNRSNQTATTYQLFNDDAVTVDHKATVSDDTTTAEKSEVGTGP